MYSELEVQFLTDECDTVLAYENKGTSDQETDRRDPLMDTLNSMNRVQQVELICGKYESSQFYHLQSVLDVQFTLKLVWNQHVEDYDRLQTSVSVTIEKSVISGGLL